MPTQRYTHHSFDVLVPCHECDGEIPVHVEGHYFREEFRIESVTNKHTGKELAPNDHQKVVIETRGDDQYPMVEALELAHRREVNAELMHEVRYGI